MTHRIQKIEVVAVVDDRIYGVGTLDELRAAAGDNTYAVVDRFADKVVVPGFIAQHDHPVLAALTMASEILSIEDWTLPTGTVQAVKDKVGFMKRLTDLGVFQRAHRIYWDAHYQIHFTSMETLDSTAF